MFSHLQELNYIVLLKVSWGYVPCMKSTRSIHTQKPVFHELRSGRASEQASEWTQRSEQMSTKESASEVSSAERSEWVSGASEGVNGGANGPVTPRVDFVVILPSVEWAADGEGHEPRPNLIHRRYMRAVAATLARVCANQHGETLSYTEI